MTRHESLRPIDDDTWWMDEVQNVPPHTVYFHTGYARNVRFSMRCDGTTHAVDVPTFSGRDSFVES